MGQFIKDVREYKVAGPNQRRFDRKIWQGIAAHPSTDAEDRALAEAGLYFDELLSAIRKRKALDDLPLPRDAAIRLVIAVATANLVILRDKMKRAPSGKDRTFHMAETLQETVELGSGDRFSPDELLGALGDGLKHVLRELVTRETGGADGDECAGTQEHVGAANEQLNVAILYDAAAAYWLDFVGHGYVLERREGGLVMRPSNKEMEISRIASSYRRRNIVFHHFVQMGQLWLRQFSPAMRRRLRGAPVVTKVHGSERIGGIDLGWKHGPMLSAVSGTAERILVITGPYQNMADSPLPGLGDLSLRQLLDAWLLVQSLTQSIYSGLSFKDESIKALWPLAPRIPIRILTATLVRALACSDDEAKAILAALTFEGKAGQEVWTQPLLRLGDDFLIVIPCVVTANLQRIADVWLRQWKIDLARKGPEFERYCMEQLELQKKGTVLDATAKVLGEMNFNPPGASAEQVDLVVLIGDTILVVETKCVLWPEEPLQFANYRTTIDDAAGQVLRKREVVERHYAAFRACLRDRGVEAPETARIVCAVLTNSAVYVGFPVRGVPVTDLLILGAFFDNKHVKAEIRDQQGKSLEQHAVQFYGSPSDAGRALEGYLLKPPQLEDTLEAVKPRSVTLPIEHERFGRLIHETFQVEVDTRALLERGRAASHAVPPDHTDSRGGV